MKKALFIIVLSIFSLSGYAQWNTDRILTIGRNALYFEDYVLSIQYFNQVIKIKPYLAEPYMYRAMAKIQLGDDKGAELDANEAIERNPFMPQAYYIRGFARRRLGLYADAANARTKMENGFDLTNYDERTLAFAKDYANQLLAIDVNLDTTEMLDVTWGLFSKYFKPEEVNIKKELVDQHWKKQ